MAEYTKTSYDEQIAIPLNEVFEFESLLFKGKAIVRAVDLASTDRKYFKGTNRKMDFTFQVCEYAMAQHLLQLEMDPKLQHVKGQSTKKALIQTAQVQCVETDAKTREYEVTGATHSVAQLQPAALLVEASPASKVMDVQGKSPNKALIKTANIQLVETDATCKEYEVSGPTSKVALVQKGATLIQLDPSVTVNYWTDEKEAVLDVTGDVKPQIKVNQGVTVVEMDPEVVLNFWTCF
eukprot:20325_1